MKKRTTGVFVFSLAGVMMGSACGSEDGIAPEAQPEADRTETAALETEPEAAATVDYTSLAGDRLTANDLSLGLKAERREAGWTVDAVVPESPAALAGIRPGDLMLTIDDLAVDAISEETEREFRDQLSKGTVEVMIERDGQALTFVVETVPSTDMFPLYFPNAPRVNDKALVAGLGCFTTCVGTFACVLPTSFGTSCFCIPCSVF